MKYLFIVQGEGRGHMTQAISLFQILKEAGHEVTKVIVGKSKRRSLPTFFSDNITSPIVQVESPNFVTDKNNQSVSIWKTLSSNALKTKTFLRSIQTIDQIVQKDQPDVVLNFYDFLGGLYFLIKRPKKVKHIALAHQFLLGHSTFEFPKGKVYDKRSLLTGNSLAGYGAVKKLCLSFQHFEDEPKRKIFVTPPLLRKTIKELAPSQGDHFLVYMVNDGYSAQVEAFHQKYPEVSLHCFWDKKNMPTVHQVDSTLTFHQLDEHKFLDYMKTCKGYLTTAGFESVCEAMYLGKPVLMVPVQGHYEQSCNALDAQKAGAGISSKQFDLEVLLNYLPDYQPVGERFQSWCSKTQAIFLKHLTEF